MRIALLSRYFSFKNAGLGRIAMEVSSRLEERGHDVVRVACDTDGLARYAYKTLWGIRHDIPRDCDVYHALSPMEALHIPPHKSVVTINDIILLTHPGLAGAKVRRNWLTRRLDASFFYLMTATVVRRCRRVLAISTMVADDLAAHPLLPIMRSGIDVIKLGISPDLKPGPRPAYDNGEVDDVFRVGYLGQLDPRKRVGLLLEAWLESDVDGELLIAGTGVQADVLKFKALLNGDGRVRFLGEIPDADLPAFYQSLDVFVFPSAIEGLGLPPLEAMACGVPVVVMKDAIMPDEVKRRCFQTADLRTTFEVLPDIQLHVGGDEPYHFAKTYDWERTVDHLEQVYQEVAP